MSRKVNYIVVCFLGERRVKSVSTPELFMKKHLQFLSDKNIDVDRVTVVVNSDEVEEVKRALAIIRSFKPYYTDLRVLVRPNYGLSYSAWSDVINSCIENDDDFTHYFLMEDDYVPTTSDFLDTYESKMEPGVAFVCQKLSHKELSQMFGTQKHAGISNGLLLASAARESYEKFGSALLTMAPRGSDEDTTYGEDSILMQVHFLDYITDIGYKMVDCSDICSVPFLHGYDQVLNMMIVSKDYMKTSENRGWFLIEWGNAKMPRVIEPVVEWGMYSPIEKMDVEWEVVSQ